MSKLTSIDAVKAFGAITGSEMDSLIDALIVRASAAVEAYIDGVVLSQAVTEVRDGTGGQAMMLRERRVTAVASVTVSGLAIPAASGYGQHGWWRADRTLLLTGYWFAKGRGNVVVQYTAGYATTPPDIEQACIEAVLLALKRRDHIDVSSKSLAGESVSFITADLTPSAKQALDAYRNVGLFQ